MPLGGNNFFFHIILNFKQNIPFLSNHQSALKQETHIQSTICDFPSHLSSLHKQRHLKRTSYRCMKETNCNNDILPTAGLVCSFYRHMIATQDNKNVNWTNGRKRCSNMFVELWKARNVSAQGMYVRIQIAHFV